MFNRTDVVALMKPWIMANPDILAVWEGGSAATGRLDEYSDLDLSIVVEDDAIEKIFAAFDTWIEKTFGIIHKYRVPEPTWHGLSQCFYDVDKVTPFVYLDIDLIKRSLPHKMMETDRHGHGVLWFDRIGVYNPAPSPREEIKERGHRLFSSITQTDFLTMIEVEKGLARGHFIDVFPTYMAFVQRHLGVALNLKYRPEKADFGTRYGRVEYGKKDAALLENAMQARGIDELRRQYAIVKRRYQELISELAPIWKQ